MNKMNDYIEERVTLRQRIGMLLVSVVFLGIFWFCLAVGNAYEDHMLCMNGAVEHCIPEDFQ